MSGTQHAAFHELHHRIPHTNHIQPPSTNQSWQITQESEQNCTRLDLQTSTFWEPGSYCGEHSEHSNLLHLVTSAYWNGTWVDAPFLCITFLQYLSPLKETNSVAFFSAEKSISHIRALFRSSKPTSSGPLIYWLVLVRFPHHSQYVGDTGGYL